MSKVANKFEIFPIQFAPNHFKLGLSENEVLFSFHLGKRNSYRWSVTRNRLILKRIAAESDIAEAVRSFRRSVREEKGSNIASQEGEKLYGLLFGELSPEETEKQDWLLSLEGDLFEAPFAALVTERTIGQPKYLVMGHTVQVVPGALSLNAPAWGGARDGEPAGYFVGVGDPVYNLADARSAHAGAAIQLPRLVASAEEIRESAGAWAGTASSRTLLLTGPAATPDSLLRSLERHPPAILHLATHVLPVPGKPQQSFIALSAGQLTTADVAMLHVPGSLVVMSGCGTGLGSAQPGAGLIGLTRAWQIAGAGTVLATLWPVADRSTALWPAFYRNLAQHSPAGALRIAQMELIRGGGSPAAWAYQVSGGAR